MYNQDWLFCWCLQVRMRGTVYLDNAFEDVDFPYRKCHTIADVARTHVGVHHTNPRRIRALWRAYGRVLAREGNASLSALDPSSPQDCRLDPEGTPYHHLPWATRAYVATLRKPVTSGQCSSALDDPAQQKSYPSWCIAPPLTLPRRAERASHSASATTATYSTYSTDCARMCVCMYVCVCVCCLLYTSPSPRDS